MAATRQEPGSTLLTSPPMMTPGHDGKISNMMSYQSPPGLSAPQGSSGSSAPQQVSPQAWQNNQFFTGPMMLVSQLTERSEGRHPTAADQSSSTHRVGGVTLPGTGGVGATMSSLQEDLQDAYPDDSMEVDHPSMALRDACLLYTSPSPRDQRGSRMPSSA